MIAAVAERMIARDLTDAVLARQLAFARWGPTGFHCDRCGHDQGWHLAGSRPRVFQCKKCRKPRSVTARTVMHGSKLPLRVWFARGELHEAGELPTSSAFAEEHEIAVSSAWHLNQRFMAAIDLGHPEHTEFGGHFVLEHLRCRRPQPTPALPADAPSYFHETWARFLDRTERPPLRNAVGVGPGGKEMVLLDACASPAAIRRMNSQPLVINFAANHIGFDRYLRAVIERKLGTVSLRWLSRYVRCVLALWSRKVDHRIRPVEWLGAVLAGPPRALPALRDAAISAARSASTPAGSPRSGPTSRDPRPRARSSAPTA